MFVKGAIADVCILFRKWDVYYKQVTMRNFKRKTSTAPSRESSSRGLIFHLLLQPADK